MYTYYFKTFYNGFFRRAEKGMWLKYVVKTTAAQKSAEEANVYFTPHTHRESHQK